jgi:hypothetical protein
MSWWWEYFEARRMTPYFRAVKEISDRMLASGQGSFEPLTVEAGNLHAFGVRCGKNIYVYLFNPEHSMYLSDLIIPADGRTYRIQSYDPAYRMYQDVTKAAYSPSAVTLSGIALGAEKEILYVLEPVGQ